MDFTKSSPGYLDYMRDIFSVCANKHVIELGPFYGWHTDLIMFHKPASITLVDSNLAAVDYLNSKFSSPTTTVIAEDVHRFYYNNHTSDVVICCGVLYHLHSPFLLLEQIANESSPDTIILDNVPSLDTPVVNIEHDNTPGNRHTNGRRSCGLSVVFHFNDILTAMKNLGYCQVYVDDNLAKFKVDTKRGWIAVFRKATNVK